ncbi:hypothetical protein PDN30_28060 [Bacillus cereus]|nr:hypothetical protein [Bacillus cereus]
MKTNKTMYWNTIEDNAENTNAKIADLGATHKAAATKPLSKGERMSYLMQILREARGKYGRDFVVINLNTELAPDWKIIPQKPRGSAGIKDRYDNDNLFM